MIILRLRAEKALERMKTLLSGQSNREEVRQMVIQNWQKAEMAGMGSKNNIKFNFEITEDNFIGKALPI